MLLVPMLARLAAARELHDVLRVGLQDVIALHGTEMGNVQLLGHDQALVIVEGKGMSLAFLRAFERVPLGDASICARAARLRKPVFVRDVAEDADFAPYRELAASVPFRSVLSCPLVTRAGEFIGAVSAHSSHLFTPTALELGSLEAYATCLAEAIVQKAPAEGRAEGAERASRALLARAAGHAVAH